MHKALQITISDDGLTATMVVKKAVLEKQKELTYPGLPDVLTGCEEWGIVYGIDNDKIVQNLKFKDMPIVIAKGKPMVPTIPDKVEYTFEDMRNKTFTPTILADDKANFYEMIKFKVVQTNELLVFIKKGRQGTNGLTVTGKEIVADKYLPMTVDLLKRFCGKNVKLAPEGITSENTGIPLIAPDGKVTVDETYVVKGDVDFNTGSVDFDGPIIVKGSVTNNFTVKSPKDIIIEGIVDGGIIESGGMVTLLGGVNKGKIYCKKNLAAKYIYFSIIKSEGSVIVDEAILNSNVLAKTIIAKGEPKSAKSGQISGGKLVANNFVWAKSLGSGSSNYTDITIKSFIDTKPLEELDAEKEKLKNEFEKVMKTIGLMEDLKKKTTNLPPSFQPNMVKLLKTKLAFQKKIQSVNSQIKIIEDQIVKENEECMRKVFISVSLFSKVSIKLMDKKAQTMQDYGPSIIHIDEQDGNIKITPATGKMDLPKDFQ
jgi:uncharacterized protein (DUF342 family)